ncbi:hypothetical protein HRG_006994 [Hirsutella rhossiliensis]|uniref:Uncharacterized protein n=1 Tax=Hirsutella rhossiliensis TaxID=111463 RepID=A0A9P8MVH1_9HYPO|nr:uncharacterized protein HRG_06994 [Hirsutella rhossiliensis]KAH0961914.1 hypothetical protein HRG_06994 [Hirsutella rhossiliensis]
MSYAAPLCSKAVVELVVYTILYGAIFGFHERRAIPTYNRKFRKSKSYHLPVHIVTGLFEITRYQLRVAVHGETVAPGPVDVLVCLVWAWSSLELVRSLQRGDPLTTRPAYQAGTVLRPLASLAAYALQSPPLYRVCAKAINSFLYARLGIFIVDKSGFMREHSNAAVYAICIPLSAVLGIYEGGYPGAVPVYVASVLAVAWLNRWVSRGLREQRSRLDDPTADKSLKDRFLAAMLALGFAELPDIKRIQRRRSLSSDIRDEYIHVLRRESGGVDYDSSRQSSVDSDVPSDWQGPWKLKLGDK